MIKIQSSYKIIKNHSIQTDDESNLILTGDINLPDRKSFIAPSEEEKKDIIDLESYREEIRNSLIEEITKDIYKETKSEVQKIIEAAKEDAKKLEDMAKEQGYEAGLVEGYKKGYNQAVEEAKDEALSIKNNALRIIEDAETHVSNYYKKSKKEIIRLAADMAESIIHTSINESSENIVRLIKPILNQFGKTENIIISCHPDGHDYLKLYLHKLEEISPNTIFTILEDGNLEENGCIIENENTIIDLQIKKQINSIIESLKDINNMECCE